MTKLEYVYLIYTRESFERNESIYKIGRTQQDDIGRFKDYPKNSKLLLHINCVDSVTLEKHLIDLFTKTFQRCDRCKLYGNEYFNGDYLKMIEIILREMNYACSLNQSKLVISTINDLENQVHVLKKDNESLRKNEKLPIAYKDIKNLQHQSLEKKLYYENEFKIKDSIISQLQKELIDIKVQIDETLDETIDDDVTSSICQPIDNDDMSNHKPSDESCRCFKCNKTFSTIYTLKVHSEKCKGVHSLQCPLCKIEFTTRQAKHTHMKNKTCRVFSQSSTIINNDNTTNNNTTKTIDTKVHIDDDVTSFICQPIEKKYVMSNHKPKYSCPSCKKEFATRQSKHKHIKNNVCNPILKTTTIKMEENQNMK